MPQIPDLTDFGQRPNLNPASPVVSVTQIDPSQSARGLGYIAQGLSGVGNAAATIQQHQDHFKYNAAKSNILRKSIELQAMLKDDPNYSTHEEIYRIGMDEARQAAFEDISDNVYRQQLDNDFALTTERGLAEVGANVLQKEGDAGRADLAANLEKNQKALLQTTDPVTRAQLMTTSSDLINNAATRGWITQEGGVKLKQNFAEQYATQRIALLPTGQQMQLLKPSRGKNGEIFFPETGNWTDALSTQTKIKIYENAQAEFRTKINVDVSDIKEAARLGLHIPKEKILGVSSMASAAGLTNVAQDLNRYAKIQDEADRFAGLSFSQQQTELNNVRTSIEKSGNLKEVDKYAAFNNILETKAEYLKKDPYAYYSAHGIIANPTPIDVSNPVSIAQNLEGRRVENEKVKQVEGQNFEMPVFTRQEIEQLKNINQTASADQMGTILNNIGVNLQPKERAALARQLAKEDAPTLAVAMSMNNQKDSIDIIAGSKLKGEVAPSKLRTETSSKLSGLVLDPEKSEMFQSAIADAYKKKAFDAGNVEKDVDTDLLDQAIEQVAGKPVEISPRGKTSKVFTYRDDSGSLVSENDLEDTFNSIDDNVLKQTNGSLPFLPSGDVVTAKEILDDTKLVTFGNGKYVPYYEGVGYLVGQDGKPYVIDAKRVKELTGNAPANDGKFGRIQTRPSQSIFGFN